MVPPSTSAAATACIVPGFLRAMEETMGTWYEVVGCTLSCSAMRTVQESARPAPSAVEQ
jgi:hypothetical protein